MHDWLSMGYLIRNRHTVLVWLSKGKDGEPVSVGFILKDMSTEKLSYIKTF